jgi:hypothetical protein
MLTTLLHFTLLLPLAYHLFPALTEYQPKVYSTLLFSPATQTYCSEAEEDFRLCRYGVLGQRLPPVDCLWSYGVFLLQCFRECLT